MQAHNKDNTAVDKKVLSVQDLQGSGNPVTGSGSVEAVTFAEWPGSDSRDLWWRRQLCRIQGHQGYWERRQRTDSFPCYNSPSFAGQQAEYM